MLAQKTHMCSGMDKHQGLIDWYKSDKECIFWQKWVTITLLLPSDKKELQKDPKECGFEAFITKGYKMQKKSAQPYLRLDARYVHQAKMAMKQCLWIHDVTASVQRLFPY